MWSGAARIIFQRIFEITSISDRYLFITMSIRLRKEHADFFRSKGKEKCISLNFGGNR